MSFISKGDGRKIVALSFCKAQFYFKKKTFSRIIFHLLGATVCRSYEINQWDYFENIDDPCLRCNYHFLVPLSHFHPSNGQDRLNKFRFTLEVSALRINIISWRRNHREGQFYRSAKIKNIIKTPIMKIDTKYFNSLNANICGKDHGNASKISFFKKFSFSF